MITESLVIVAGLALAALARRHSAAVRHWILTAAILCASLSPLFDRVLPVWSMPVPDMSTVLQTAGDRSVHATAAVARDGAAARAAGPVRTRIPESLFQWLTTIWIAGSVLSFLVLLIGIGRLWWLAAHARRLHVGDWTQLAIEIARERGLARSVTLIQNDHHALLVTWGFLQPTIMLPAGAQGWPASRVRVVLRHELAHIERGDWMPQLLAEILRSVYWFNPLLWIASRRLRLESERACDDAVLRSGIDGTDYATHLLDVARATRQARFSLFPGSPAPAMARPGSLEKRVSAMLNTQLRRNPTTAGGRLVTAGTLLVLTMTVAAVGARAQGTFSGSVVDPMNAAVPAVTVVITNTQTGATQQVKSDRTGRFEFAALPPGDYLIEARLPGFATIKGHVTVTGGNVQKELALELGSIEETITVVATPDAAPSSPPRGPSTASVSLPPCTPSETGGNIRAPLKLKDVRPRYPEAAVASGAAGTVILATRVRSDGLVGDLEVRDAPNADLATAAAEAVRQWAFTPTLLNCIPVEVAMRVTVNFQLRQ